MRLRIAFAAFTLLALAGFHLQPSLADSTPPRPQASYSAPVASSGPTAESGRAALVAAIRAAKAQQDADLAAFYAWASHLPAPARRQSSSAPAVYGSGACGGDLPPCSVMMCESGGSLTAQNPRSTASGKWQILDSTWAGYGGYSRAMYAPEDVQDARAREIYAGGAGRRAWVC